MFIPARCIVEEVNGKQWNFFLQTSAVSLVKSRCFPSLVNSLGLGVGTFSCGTSFHDTTPETGRQVVLLPLKPLALGIVYSSHDRGDC